MTKSPGTLTRIFNWLKTSVWVFPLVLLAIVAILVLGKVHGSSIGVYYEYFYGDEVEDRDLLYGTPQTIRSDEWLLWTQFTMTQAETGFPAFNENLGSGRDLSMIPTAPFLDWLTVFRPQTWSFFVMPLNYAFSLQWWMMPFLLIVSSYFFFLRILSGKKFLSIILSLSFMLSPFIIWWWQAALFLPLAYAFFILILAMRIINQENIWRIKSRFINNLFYVLGLAYLCISLALILYAPFVISIAIVVAAFIIGYGLQQLSAKKIKPKNWYKRMALFIPVVILVAIAGLGFAVDRKDMIQSISDSVYPGQRLTESGGLNHLYIVDGFLMPLLQDEERGGHYITNQSHDSNFVLLLPFLLLPAFLLQLYEYRKRKRVDWLFLSINLCIVLFLIRAFVPLGDIFYKLLLLDRVPHERLLAGIGFVGIIQLVLFINKLQQLKLATRRLIKYALPYGLVCFFILLIIGAQVMEDYSRFLTDYGTFVPWAGFFIVILVAFLINKPRLGAVLLLSFTLLSVYKVMPLYRKLDIITKSEVINSIKEVSQPDDYWITVDSLLFENFPAIAGRGLVNGVQIYADVDYWHPIGDGKYEDIYNRQAHAVFYTGPDMEEEMELKQQGYFQVAFSCSDFVRERAGFVLAPHPIDYPCLNLVKTVPYHHVGFHIYEIH